MCCTFSGTIIFLYLNFMYNKSGKNIKILHLFFFKLQASNYWCIEVQKSQNITCMCTLNVPNVRTSAPFHGICEFKHKNLLYTHKINQKTYV